MAKLLHLWQPSCYTSTHGKAPAGRPVSVPSPIKRKGSRFYYIRVKVPQGAREALGKTELWQSLETESLAVARARAVVEVGRMGEQIGVTYDDLDRPSGCTEDCSGREAGVAWAQDNDIHDPLDCGGRSRSFVEGCEAYGESVQQAAEGITDDTY